MEQGPRAIETEYKGYRFRSRLEARWAVFFDKMGFQFEYEKEGFELPSGRYLPDFYLPDLNIWAEVKPKLPPAERLWESVENPRYVQDSDLLRECGIPFRSLHEFTSTGPAIFCLVGLPQDGLILLFDQWGEPDVKGVICSIWNRFAECQVCSRLSLMRDQDGFRPFTMAIEAKRRCPIGCDVRVLGPSLLNVDWAANEARAARFEHGQMGGPSDWKR